MPNMSDKDKGKARALSNSPLARREGGSEAGKCNQMRPFFPECIAKSKSKAKGDKSIVFLDYYS